MLFFVSIADFLKQVRGKVLFQFQMETLKNEFESCAIKCVDDHLKLLPNLLKRMKASLDKASQQ